MTVAVVDLGRSTSVQCVAWAMRPWAHAGQSDNTPVSDGSPIYRFNPVLRSLARAGASLDLISYMGLAHWATACMRPDPTLPANIHEK
jgi:hypothetical protein